MRPEALLNAAAELGVVPLFYDPDAERAQATVAALAAGGANIVEYTLRGPGAEHVLAALVSNAPAGVTIGAGSVRDLAGANRALDAGAAFIVGPNGNREVADRCSDADVAYVPGCLTPSEAETARSWGCPLVKIFPVSLLGGPAYVRALRGPLPDLRLMATGGVGLDDVDTYLRAGTTCVGLGSDLVKREWVERDDGRPLADATARVLERAHGVRTGSG